MILVVIKMGAQVRAGKQFFTKLSEQLLEQLRHRKQKKRINIVIEVLQTVIFGISFIVELALCTNVNFDLTNALNS